MSKAGFPLSIANVANCDKKINLAKVFRHWRIYWRQKNLKSVSCIFRHFPIVNDISDNVVSDPDVDHKQLVNLTVDYEFYDTLRT